MHPRNSELCHRCFFTVPGPSPATNKVLHGFIAMIRPARVETKNETGTNNYMKPATTVWTWFESADVAGGFEERRVKLTLENQQRTASLLCRSLRRRWSRRPIQTPGNSRDEKRNTGRTCRFNHVLCSFQVIKGSVHAWKLKLVLAHYRRGFVHVALRTHVHWGDGGLVPVFVHSCNPEASLHM